MFVLFLLLFPLVIVGVVLFGLLSLLLPLLGFLISLPFRILGFVLGIVGWAIALPFLIIAGALGILGLLAGLFFGGLFLLLPLLPLALVIGALVWLVRRSRPRVVAG